MNAKDFPQCPICATNGWTRLYNGPVRDGIFGASREATVARCSGCGVDRLAESACLQKEDYESHAYRAKLAQAHDVGRHFDMHDELARFTTEIVWPRSLRKAVVADIGCGGGSLLDHLGALPARAIAVDPDQAFAPSLHARGYDWYASCEAAGAAIGAGLDIAFCIQVIEHVDAPREFLASIRALLKPSGILVLSTPNRRDILMDLLPDDFPAFFYRTQHRWAFDADSLGDCARRAGFAVAETRHVHRYGMANAIHWLRDRKPKGRTALPPLDAAMDKHWQAWLEATGRADNLYLVLTPA
jgi:SAM-dependent methyltransferase